jgi:nucleoside-diphosphate-sugar epimerase
MKKVLILGGGGFIGGNLAKKLKSEGHWVRIVDIKRHEYFKVEEICDEFIQGDLTDPKIVSIAMFAPGQSSLDDKENSFDEVYQLAADMGGAGYIFTGENDANVMHNSALINLNVTHYASLCNVKKIFYSSSACIYPEHNQLDPDNPNCVESSAYPAYPDSAYGWEKLFGERLYDAYYRNKNLNIRIARFHNIFGPCFDDKTEVLTKDGWKLFKDIDDNDEFASLSDDNKLIYLKAVDKQAYYYKGDMYQTKSEGVDQLVTPEHSVYVSSLTTVNGRTKQTGFKLRKVKDIKWDINKLYYTSYFEWVGEIKSLFYQFPRCYMVDGRTLHDNKSISMLDWFEFIGWFVSEGSKFKTSTNYTTVLTQYEKTNSENRCKIKELLTRMNINFSEDKNKTQIIISNKQVYDSLECEGILSGAKNKAIPNWMLQYPKEYLLKLYDSLMAGDGRRYNTTSPILKDQFMELALKLGKQVSCSQSEIPIKEQHNKIYRIYISNRKHLCTKRNSRTLVNYDGMVYDVTLPQFHTLLVRRNGKVCWSGNCGTYKGGKEKAPAAMCRKAIETPEGGSLEVWGDGQQTRSFLYIDECLNAVQKLMESNCTEPVNIGSEEMISINNLAKMAIELSNKKVDVKNIFGDEFLIKYGFICPTGVRGRNSNNNLFEYMTGYRINSDLREGMVKTFEWINKIMSNG